ncbi:glyoxylate/hydroxypyruvate reductase A [Siccirubricoccus sp. KC 17139]|uniref:Glyoxylate/hydroxypyruvate reductase A n=1 Tax=Siccirubricoccus soli TaxID=2899147 RepID=A0ABT1D563_9PROT|nr:glyoxylate/hydroxypyruvate reductase A [Siccirubricoccus soli]MCO6417065.1 glyoxylate/hydroxypyruvate reductase A [Siccirubricoccus soli]MCP2683200.1 glyoxylate/hydroxypyruvate reductase A [Siccirubricoccus soli]
MSNRRVMVVKSGGAAGFAEWQGCFAALDPALELIYWDDAIQVPERIDYALLWDPEPGWLARMPNLKVIFGSGAGVDLIAADPDLPRHLPLVRMSTPEATQRMGEFVCWAVLSLLKDGRRMAIAQAERRWDYFEPPFRAQHRTVGILGLGNMGQRCAEMLRGLGFPVIGWSRTPKAVQGVENYAGAGALDAFLGATDILVCLLPATPETQGIIDAATLGRLRPGGGFVGVGRGMQHDLDAIMAALDSGQLAGAVLDVFEPEPLPSEHPLWAHPKAILTPHVASLPTKAERAGAVAAAIAAYERGETLPNLYDHVRGY